MTLTTDEFFRLVGGMASGTLFFASFFSLCDSCLSGSWYGETGCVIGAVVGAALSFSIVMQNIVADRRGNAPPTDK